jgi:hypothetical protein
MRRGIFLAIGILALRANSRHCRTYSITSSARANNVGGTSSPSALAVGRLMKKSHLVDRTTGMSTGLALLRTRLLQIWPKLIARKPRVRDTALNIRPNAFRRAYQF